MVSGATMALAWTPRREGAPNRQAVAAALATSAMICGYSVVDGIGVRLSGSTFGYAGGLFMLELPFIAYIVWRRRGALGSIGWPSLRNGFLGGFCAAGAYTIVIYAKTLAPLATVSAVRESSVVIAALIGVVIFGERPWRRRLVCAGIVGAGVAALSIAG